MARILSGGASRAGAAANSRRFVLAAVLLGGLVILGAGALLALAHRDTPRGAAGTLLASAIGGPFRLVDQNRKTVTAADLKGKRSLVDFGDTPCPAACPPELTDHPLAH